ncbi:MAG: polysaccharide deacetylase family protein [Candidatus Omnitrophica bacterium]|nr:polysaccharide deacetylase family protein [Candidatus Omnitrophota bacterium]
MLKDKYLTISVDDGHPTDSESAELLSKYGLKATFYIPKINPEREVMKESDIKKIADSFEIGGHTYGHKPLCGLADNEVKKEVQDGKNWMEQLLGRQVVAFCYPKGKFSAFIIRAVKDSGFKGARTCMWNLNDFPKNPFLWGFSTHAHTHSMAIQIRHAILEKNFKGLMNFFLVQKGSVDWVNQFKFAVEYVEQNGGIAHLYFHSWEIDKLNEWKRLEDLFRYLSQMKDLKRITNGDLFKMYYDRKRIA